MFAKGKKKKTNNRRNKHSDSSNNRQILRSRSPERFLFPFSWHCFFSVFFLQIKKCVMYLTAAITIDVCVFDCFFWRLFFATLRFRMNGHENWTFDDMQDVHLFVHSFFNSLFLFFSLKCFNLSSFHYRYVITCKRCIAHLLIDRKRFKFVWDNNKRYIHFTFQLLLLDIRCCFFIRIAIKNMPCVCVFVSVVFFRSLSFQCLFVGGFIVFFSSFLSNIHKIIN